MRISAKTVNKHLKKEIENTFLTIIEDLKSQPNIELFFKDFLTTTEFEMLSKRLAIAYWLRKGRSYTNIKDNLKVSSATIASVQDYSQKPGYQLALKLLEADEWASKWSERIKGIVKPSKAAS